MAILLSVGICLLPLRSSATQYDAVYEQIGELSPAESAALDAAIPDPNFGQHLEAVQSIDFAVSAPTPIAAPTVSAVTPEAVHADLTAGLGTQDLQLRRAAASLLARPRLIHSRRNELAGVLGGEEEKLFELQRTSHGLPPEARAQLARFGSGSEASEGSGMFDGWEKAAPNGLVPATTVNAVQRAARAQQDAADRELAKLKTESYAILPPGALLDPEAVARVLAVAEREWFQNGKLEKLGLPRTRYSLDNALYIHYIKQDNPDMDRFRADLQPMVDLLTERLNAALGSEKIALLSSESELRISRADKTDRGPFNIHIDEDPDFTATLALLHRSTPIHYLEDGRVVTREAATLSWVVMTSLGREYFTGIPATVHGFPAHDGNRVVLNVTLGLLDRQGVRDIPEWRNLNKRAGKRVSEIRKRLDVNANSMFPDF